MSIYLDCAATTPIEPRVLETVKLFLATEFGNAGSRTHEFGTRAKAAVEEARRVVAEEVDAESREVVFTSGATESNNLAILGLLEYGRATGKKHIVSTAVEHKAVLEPLTYAEKQGFTISILPVSTSGLVDPRNLERELRPETLLVSVMHVNNETGVIQDLRGICKVLAKHEAFFHTDSAQSFGKLSDDLKNRRIDLMSISGHKLFAPKGIGALISRNRGYDRIPLKPLMFGGGQEFGIRPGTLPVHLIAGFGEAVRLARKERSSWRKRCLAIRMEAIEALSRCGAEINGDTSFTVPHILNVSFPRLDSEAAILALKGLIAVSNGSACTSHDYKASHVLAAMQLSDNHIRGGVRFSWCHLTPPINWKEVVQRISDLQ